MSIHLRHVYLKTKRAHDHLDALKWTLEIFYNSKPYTVRRFNDAERSRHVIRVEMQDPIDRTALLAGDFAHSLRSSLDNLVYLLATYNTKELPQARIQWPVLESQDDSLFKKQTEGVCEEAAGLIELLQPYHAGDAFKRTYLWQLHKLDIIDKQRRIPLDVHGMNAHFGTTLKPEDVTFEIFDKAHEVYIPLSAADIEVQFDPPSSIGVVFGDEREGIRVNFDIMSKIYNFVTEEVIRKFERFFP